MIDLYYALRILTTLHMLLPRQVVWGRIGLPSIGMQEDKLTVNIYGPNNVEIGQVIEEKVTITTKAITTRQLSFPVSI